MPDIKDIPEAELRKDLQDSYEDIIHCTAALTLGIMTYSDGKSVQERFDANQCFVTAITAELKRRGLEI